nr:hypothetical protein [Paenibacillus sp. B01]
MGIEHHSVLQALLGEEIGPEELAVLDKQPSLLDFFGKHHDIGSKTVDDSFRIMDDLSSQNPFHDVLVAAARNPMKEKIAGHSPDHDLLAIHAAMLNGGESAGYIADHKKKQVQTVELPLKRIRIPDGDKPDDAFFILKQARNLFV